MGHFSKFIRPGAKRIIASSNDDRLLTTAFINTDGKISVVILNTTDEALEAKCWMENQSAPLKSPAHSIVTLLIGT